MLPDAFTTNDLATPWRQVSSRPGGPPRGCPAQAAIRHSTIDLIIDIHTEPRLLDMAGALEALPWLTMGSRGKVTIQTGG